jgi:predicted SprT family Zn-dependent metalloprotease
MSLVRGDQLELAFPGQRSAEGSVPSRGAVPGAVLELHRRRLSGYLSVLLPEPVDVVLNNNRSTMVSFQRRAGRIVVRLHRMFRHADDKMLGVLARFIGAKDRRASAELDRFIAEHRREVHAPVRKRARTFRARGDYFDLQEILGQLNDEYFGGPLDVRIGWGRRQRRKRRRARTRSRALAVYAFDDQVIRVNPVLDSAEVPRYVVEWVVYHELLHHVLPVERTGGRSRYHTRRFKALERAFARYEEAKQWEEQHLDWLLR